MRIATSRFLVGQDDKYGQQFGGKASEVKV